MKYINTAVGLLGAVSLFLMGTGVNRLLTTVVNKTRDKNLADSLNESESIAHKNDDDPRIPASARYWSIWSFSGDH